MARPALPTSDFQATLASGSAKLAMKAAGATATSGQLFDVPVDNIRVLDGFNVRIRTEGYEKHIRSIADDMKINGFKSTKPLVGYAAKDGDDQIIYVTDGHGRLEAVKLAISEGAPITTVPVIVKGSEVSLEDLTADLVTENDGRPLEAMELATVVQRLTAFGWDDERIAAKINRTTKSVANYKILLGAPAKVRNMIVDGKIAPTEALKQLKKHGAKAAEKIEGAVKDAAEKGKTKATGKDVKAKEATTDAKPERKQGVTSSVTQRGDKLHTTTVFHYPKAGEIVEAAEIKPVRLFLESKWWNYVDANTKEHVIIEEPVTIEVRIVSDVPAEDGEKTSDAEPQVEAPALEDQSDAGTAADDTGL